MSTCGDLAPELVSSLPITAVPGVSEAMIQQTRLPSSVACYSPDIRRRSQTHHFRRLSHNFIHRDDYVKPPQSHCLTMTRSVLSDIKSITGDDSVTYQSKLEICHLSQPLSLSRRFWTSLLFRLCGWWRPPGYCFMTARSTGACIRSPLKGLMRKLASGFRNLFWAQFASFWLPSKDQKQILYEVEGVGEGDQFTRLHPVSWQSGRKKRSTQIQLSVPYLLFRAQHKSPGKSELIVLVTNKKTSSTPIYFITFCQNKKKKKENISEDAVLFMFSWHLEFLPPPAPHLCVVFCSYKVIDGD